MASATAFPRLSPSSIILAAFDASADHRTMNLRLLQLIRDDIEMGLDRLFIVGSAVAEIRAATQAAGLATRFVSPAEFSPVAIHEDRRIHGGSFISALYRTLGIPEAVRFVVFEDVHQLTAEQGAVLEALLKKETDQLADAGIPFVCCTVPNGHVPPERVARCCKVEIDVADFGEP